MHPTLPGNYVKRNYRLKSTEGFEEYQSEEFQARAVICFRLPRWNGASVLRDVSMMLKDDGSRCEENNRL